MLSATLNKSWKQHLYKMATVRSLTSHLTNYPSKTNTTSWIVLLERQVQTRKRCSLLILTHEITSTGRPSKTYFHQFRLYGSHDKRERERERESQSNPY